MTDSKILKRAAEAAASAIMRFKAKTGGRYYPGYHEDMRDAVKKAIMAIDVSADASLTQELNRLRDENARFEDKIEDIIAEFGADPSAALQIISEHINLRRHGRAHPNARGEE